MSDAWKQIPQIWRLVGIVLAVAGTLAAGYAKLGDLSDIPARMQSLEGEGLPTRVDILENKVDTIEASGKRVQSRQLYQVCAEQEQRAGRDGVGCRYLIRGDREMLELLEGNR